MLNALNQRVRKAFSESADQYDILASLHREIGRELMARIIKHPKCGAFLDVGCGTGYLTAKAKSYFPDAKIVGLDFAPGMLKTAAEKHEGIEWVLGDAQALPFADKSFDIVVSNLAYQWVADLPKAFGHVNRVLRAEGVFTATLFGFFTCDELFTSFGIASQEKLKFTRLPKIEDVERALKQTGFTQTKVDYERIRIQFEDMWELMKWLKSIGANNLPHEGQTTKGIMSKAATIYRERYPYHHGVCATFEVVWIEGRV
jgi:malonyl-CoA O-methyltransferase